MSRFNTHIKEHDAKFPCQYCGRIYAQSRTRRMHEDKECLRRPGATKPTGEAVYAAECSICGQKFKQARSLHRQMKTKHGEGKDAPDAPPAKKKKKE